LTDIAIIAEQFTALADDVERALEDDIIGGTSAAWDRVKRAFGAAEAVEVEARSVAGRAGVGPGDVAAAERTREIAGDQQSPAAGQAGASVGRRGRTPVGSTGTRRARYTWRAGDPLPQIAERLLGD